MATVITRVPEVPLSALNLCTGQFDIQEVL
jgi:hypothetical protein